MDFIFRAAEAFLKKHKRLQRYRRVFAFLAAVVVFATTYELILPAITMDRRRAAETPGVEVGVAAEGVEDAQETVEAEEAVEEQSAEDGDSESVPSEEAASDQDVMADSLDADDESNDSGQTAEESDETPVDLVENNSVEEENSSNDVNLSDGESSEGMANSDGTSETSEKTSDREIESEENAAVSAENAENAGQTAGDGTLTTEEIQAYPAVLTFEDPDKSYLITATFDETAALPADVSLNAVEILPDTQYKDAEDNLVYADYDEYFEKTVDTLEKAGRLEDTTVSSARFFDITFLDAEGQSVEPAAPVSIAIKYNTDVLSVENTAQTLAVHFDDIKIEDRDDIDKPEIGKAKVIETEEKVKKEEIEEISFEADRFSVYAIVGTAPGVPVSMSVGDTETITLDYDSAVTSAKYQSYSWTTSDDEVVSIESGQSDPSVTIKALTPGTATITLQYKYGKKSSQTTTGKAVYTVTVAETASLTEEDCTAQQAESSSFTVSVKSTGEIRKKLSNYHVVVEDADSSYTSESNLLKAYHIYLADSSDQEVDDLGNNLNLKVTLSYNPTPGWLVEAANIKHYKNGAEKDIKNISINADEGTISFTVSGFSDFVISSSEAGAGGGTGGTAVVATQEGSILENLTYSDANAWQIVSGTRYSGNEVANKTESGNIRVQKNIIPSGVENEFYVYLSLDVSKTTGVTKSVVDRWLSTATYCCGSSTHGSGNAVGTLGPLQGEPKGTGNHMVHVVLTYGGNVIGETDVGCDVSNPSLYLCLTDKPKEDKKKRVFILLLETLGSHGGTLDTQTVELNQEAYEALVEHVEQTTTTETELSNLTMTELIDASRFRIDSVQTDSDSSYNQTTGVWSINDRPSGTKTTTTQTGEGTSTVTTTTWTENAAELLYKVTLKPTDATFNSSEGEYFIGSQPATATYTYGSASNQHATFPNVSVKGLQYDVKIRKVDQAGNAMQGVSFTLTGNDGNGLVSGGYNLTDTTNSNGYITFAGMAWGDYTITENAAPSGYRIAAPQTVTLCYTTTPDVLINTPGDVGTDKIYNSGDGYLEFINKRNIITVAKSVTWSPSSEQDENVSKVTQTIFIALKDKSTGNYITDDDGRIIYKTITITNGTPSPSSVTFGTDEPIETGEYDVVELSAISADGKSATELKAGDRFTSNGKRIQVHTISAQETNTDSNGNVATINGNDADLTYSDTAKVAFTNTYSYETTMNFVANKKWQDANGSPISATDVPSGTTVTFTLYQNGSEYKPDGTNAYTITLDGTVDTSSDGSEITSGELTTWQATFNDLPMADTSGNNYTYTVKETACSNAEFECMTTGGAAQSGGSITNKQKATSITVKKVDDNSTFVPGASFKLFKAGETDTLIGEEFLIDSASGYTISGLISGTYKLTETNPPDGYIITNRTIEFTVNATGSGSVIAWKDATQPESVEALSKTTETDDTITVINTPGAELPETGGTGFISPQTLCGIMAMAFVLATAVMYGFSMRRGERRSL